MTKKPVNRVSFLVLLAMLLAVPITAYLSQNRQNINPRADVPFLLMKVVINPGAIMTQFNGPNIPMSAELVDQSGRFIKQGVSFDWGISSNALVSIGTLTQVNQNLAVFLPVSPGWGQLYVKVSYFGQNYVGSIWVNVLDVYPPPSSNILGPLCLKATIPPETGPAPLTVTLHGAGQAYGGASIVGYQWDFTNDGIWETQVDINPVKYVYTSAGKFYPVYRVQDSTGRWSSTCDYAYPVVVEPAPSQDEYSLCITGGGAWKVDFPNACRDLCFTPPPVSCAQVISSGCDCGPDKCWTGSGCVFNEEEVVPTPSPSSTPRPVFSIYDFKILLINYLTNADVMYQPRDEKVNLWDGAYVIKYLIQQPILCQTCDPNSLTNTCPLGYFCSTGGFCQPNCVNENPPCKIAEPLCPTPMPTVCPGLAPPPSGCSWTSQCGIICPSPTPQPICIPCQTDSDCSSSQYCTQTGWCRYNCLKGEPPCLMPEPVCE